MLSRFLHIPGAVIKVGTCLAIGMAMTVNTVFGLDHLVFEPPKDSGWINVKTDLGLKGDGKTDDTAALKAYKPKNGHDVGTFFFPEGTYIISDTITFNGTKRVLLQGMGPGKSIIRLKANSPGFNDAKKPKPAVIVGAHKLIKESDKSYPGHGQAFRNSVFNMGFEVDKGNAGAMALAYHNNNQGAVENVRIRSLDGTGHSGLALAANWPGPALISDVSVEGFDFGIWSIIGQYSMTFEHIRLKGQKKVAFYNRGQHLNIRNLRSENSVTALKIVGYATVVNIIESELIGGSPSATAIEAVGGDKKHKSVYPPLFVRDLKVSGYGNAIVSGVNAASAKKVAGPNVKEFISHGISRLGSKANASMTLNVKETPVVDPGPVAKWVSVKSFKPVMTKVKNKKGKEVEVTDWAPAIQQAIDSGAKTIYFPKGQYEVRSTAIVRGNCQVLMGMDSTIKPQGFGQAKDKPVFVVETNKDVMVSRLSDSYGDSWQYYHHTGKGNMIFRNMIFAGYKNTVSGGDVFFHDVCGTKYEFKNRSVYARQLNTEADSRKTGYFNVHIDGGSLWCLGQKLEHKLPAVSAKNAEVEVVGLWTYHGGKGPLLTDDKSKMCVTGITMSTGTYGVVVSEPGKGQLKLKHNAPNANAFRKYGAIMPAYFGH